MDCPLAWLDVVLEIGLRLFMFLSPRDEGRLATVDLIHYQIRRVLVHIAWEPRHPLSRYVFY